MHLRRYLRRQRIGQLFQRIGRDCVAAAVAGQIKLPDGKCLGQLFGDTIPYARMHAPAMQQHQIRPRAGFTVQVHQRPRAK